MSMAISNVPIAVIRAKLSGAGTLFWIGWITARPATSERAPPRNSRMPNSAPTRWVGMSLPTMSMNRTYPIPLLIEQTRNAR
jgi:threonine/homoserine/homoserine lactone efflux protein